MARLGDICSINMGQSPDSSTYNEERIGLPFFQGNADFGTLHPSVRIWCSTPVKIAKQNDILISVRAPIGALNIADMECCIGRGLAALTVNPAICEQKYVWYGLESKVEELISKGTGSTFKAISKSILLDTELPIPCLTEQVHIAAVLDKVSELIDLRKQQIAKLNELVKARFVEMFGDLLNNTMHWTFKPLAELCDVRDGTHDSPKYYSTGYPLLTSKNFTNGFVDFANASLISKEDFDAINQRSKVDYGDIVMPMIGTIGHPVIIDTNQPFAIKNVALIKFGNSEVSNVFIKEILDSNYFKAVIQEKNRGNTQKFIALGDIRKIMIPLVPTEMQSIFSNFVNNTNKEKLAIQQGLDTMETLKKALMQEYFG